MNLTVSLPARAVRSARPRPGVLHAAALGLVLLTAATCAGLLTGIDRATYGQLAFLGPQPSALHLFDPESTVIILILLAVLRPRRGRFHDLAAHTVTLAVLECFEVGGKLLLPQPAGSLPGAIAGVHLAYSYPSGHAMRAALILGLAALRLPRAARPACAAIAVLVAVALVGWGDHYATDTLAGLLLATYATLAVARTGTAEHRAQNAPALVRARPAGQSAWAPAGSWRIRPHRRAPCAQDAGADVRLLDRWPAFRRHRMSTHARAAVPLRGAYAATMMGRTGRTMPSASTSPPRWPPMRSAVSRRSPWRAGCRGRS
jgi:membrane-associated phospholipid phosphatase